MAEKRNFFITYPRSGTNWTINRARALIDLTGKDLWPGGRFIKMNHLGFAPEHPAEGLHFELDFEANEKVFVLLRDARQTLVSNWFFIRAHQRVREKINKRDPGTINSLKNFLRSHLAAKKFSNFLSKINEIKNGGRLGGVFFYEDISGYEFFYEIPALLGREYIVSEDLATRAHENSLEKINTFDTDHSTADEEDLEFIQTKLEELCILDEYRKRYLD